MTALGGLAANLLFLAFSRFGVAFGEAVPTPAGHAVIIRKIRPERRGLAIDLFAMGIPLGTMIGFSVGDAIRDMKGWRAALIGAGMNGGLIALLTFVAVRPTPQLDDTGFRGEPFFRSSLSLLSSQAFRWLFIGAVAGSFAAAPFYAFVEGGLRVDAGAGRLQSSSPQTIFPGPYGIEVLRSPQWLWSPARGH